MGPPSWQWLVAAYESSGRMFAPGGLEAVETPVLILAAQKDRLVSIDAIREAAERLPDCRLCVDPEAAHEVFRERDEIRDPLMAEVAAFLEGRAAARP
jgi:lysophospholipase